MQKNNQSGNAFFIVMIGIALFAALIFTLSRGAQQGTGNISQKQAEIAASDILVFAQKIERGVNRIQGRAEFSEQDISFEDRLNSGYANAGCTSTRCELFNTSGGSISYTSATNEMNNNSAPWLFSGDNTILGIGADATADLVLILDDVRQLVCEEINDRLNISTMPTDANGIETTTKFTGTYTASEQISDAAISGISSACVLNTAPNPDRYVFYHVLIAR